MTFVLDSKNVFDYLVQNNFCNFSDQSLVKITAKEFKNFNLLVSLGNRYHILVKQERQRSEGKNRNELWHEWRIQELFVSFTDLKHLLGLTSEVLLFDPENAVIVLNYFNDYCDLNDFYARDNYQVFPLEIATALGQTLATIHRSTFENQNYKLFLTEPNPYSSSGLHPSHSQSPKFLRGLERINPDIFSNICTDGLEFWRLYQRYDSLHQGMVQVSQAYEPCCLTHNDLRLWNILANLHWNDPNNPMKPSSALVRLIDWEFFSWGDPAYDLGMVLAGYLKLWLQSLVVSNGIAIDLALRLATTPLDRLQPSMIALIQAYLGQFPEILESRPDFLTKVLQFTGLVLLKRIQDKLEQLIPFDNTAICTLQVAKTLLCAPESSVLHVFGKSMSEMVTHQSFASSRRHN